MSASEPTTRPWTTTYSAAGLVCSVDHLASSAGVQVLAAGGSAADAAIAASAVLAVTTPAHVRHGRRPVRPGATHGQAPPDVLDAVGPGRLAAPTPTACGPRATPRCPSAATCAARTVPGCVDGWVALHERHGRLPAGRRAGARPSRLAEDGFPACRRCSAFMLAALAGVEGCDELAAARPGDR